LGQALFIASEFERSVAIQANVLAYQDGFLTAAIGAVFCLLLVAVMSRGRPSPF
jgi:hypothetical protein